MIRAYNTHPKTWDDRLPFLQFAYNRATHSFLAAAPFEVCLGFLPKAPIDLTFTPDDATPVTAADGSPSGKAQAFIRHIQLFQQHTLQYLLRTQAKQKLRHDSHRQHKEFSVGDRVWLYLSMEHLKGEGRKLEPVRYGLSPSFGASATTYRLDLPPYMNIYATANVDDLKLFEPSLLDEAPPPLLSSLDSLAMHADERLPKDTIVETKTITTLAGTRTSLRIGLHERRLTQSKWFSEATPAGSFLTCSNPRSDSLLKKEALDSGGSPSAEYLRQVPSPLLLRPPIA